VVVQAYNPSTQEAEAGELGAQSQPETLTLETKPNQNQTPHSQAFPLTGCARSLGGGRSHSLEVCILAG
jgi:hypothetical protein